MTRFASRVDRNQAEIVYALRRVGAEVEPIHWCGRGIPDLLVKFPKDEKRARLFLLEVKDGEKAPSARKLTEAEEKFAARFPVVVVETVADALAAIGLGVANGK